MYRVILYKSRTDYISYEEVLINLKNIFMRTFIVGFLFVAAIFFPILFMPLFVITLVVMLIVSPHVHEVWSDPKHEHGNVLKH